jgi:predicted transposase/invertase (TIGR01784 family)
MIPGIDPKVDYAFKHVFGREANRPILIDLIDAVLNPAPSHQIVEIELLNPFNLKETLDDKISILDIKARDQAGRQFNVEMQMLAYQYFEKRILYYWSRLHQQQLHEGQDYGAIRPTVSISFLDHQLFPQVPDYHLHFRLLEASHGFALSDDIDFHMLELPKFRKSEAELATPLDRWLYFLRYAEKIDTGALPAPLQHPPVVQAFEDLKMISEIELERERYEARRKWLMDYNSGLTAARQQGKEEGLKLGQVGTIHFCERLLGRPETPAEELVRSSLEELTQMAEGLQQQVSKGR